VAEFCQQCALRYHRAHAKLHRESRLSQGWKAAVADAYPELSAEEQAAHVQGIERELDNYYAGEEGITGSIILDVEHLGEPPEGQGWIALCEGCGHILVDGQGRCISDCEFHHGPLSSKH